jgi:hypothetical protein
MLWHNNLVGLHKAEWISDSLKITIEHKNICQTIFFVCAYLKYLSENCEPG